MTGTPTCGETITTSLTLTANLDCSADTTTSALIIGASGVTVNLNGFSILGPGANASTIGIDDRSGYNSLTVKNGSMSNFYGDVMAIGSPSSILTGLTVHKLKATSNTIDNGYAVCASYVDGARVNGLNVSDDEYGVVLANSTNSTVVHNKFNSTFWALEDYQGTSNNWSFNKLVNTDSYGVYLYGIVNDTVHANRIIGSSDADAIDVQNGSGDSVTDNTLSRAYDGVYDFNGTNDMITGNKGAHDSWGIYTSYANGVTVGGNDFSYGLYGIEADDPKSETLAGNTTDHNTEAGVYVWDDNNASGYTATMTSNTADYNRFGLYSQFVTSGSANSAANNSIVNCYDVTCTAPAGSPAPSAGPAHTRQRTLPAPSARLNH